MRRIDKEALLLYREKLRMIREGGTIDPYEDDAAKKQRIERAKQDYDFMVKYYFPHYASSPCNNFHLKAAKRVRSNGQLTMIVRWGRGLAKSTHFDLLIPFWLWINSDIKVMVIVGNNEKKAQRLLSDLQAEFEANPRILNDFGAQKTFGDWADGKFITENGCAFFALGMGQSPRGLRFKQNRPDYIVADDLDDKDLVKNPRRINETAEWILRDLIPTMDDGNRRFFLVNNRYAPKTIQSTIEEMRPEWVVDRVDATGKNLEPTWHEKYHADFYKRLEKEIGSLALQAEYNNNPQVEGSVFTNEMIQWAALPRIDSFEVVCGYWDVAYSGSKMADFNSVRIMGLRKDEFWHLKAFTRQCKMIEVIRWMFDFEEDINKNREKKTIIHWRFESQFWNDALIMVLRQVEREKGRVLNIVKAERPTKKKYDRIISLQPYYQNSKIKYSEKEKGNNDMQVALAQLFGIEPGYKSHDDAPDAEAGAVEYLSRFQKNASFKPRLGPARPRHSFY